MTHLQNSALTSCHSSTPLHAITLFVTDCWVAPICACAGWVTFMLLGGTPLGWGAEMNNSQRWASCFLEVAVSKSLLPPFLLLSILGWKFPLLLMGTCLTLASYSSTGAIPLIMGRVGKEPGLFLPLPSVTSTSRLPACKSALSPVLGDIQSGFLNSIRV